MRMDSMHKNPALISLQQHVPANIDMKKIDAAAKDFEAMFVSEMVKPMFEDLKTDGMFGGGKGEEVFRGLMIDEYGKMVAETGQLGVSDLVRAAMIEMQVKASNPNMAQNMHNKNMGAEPDMADAAKTIAEGV